MKMFTFSRTVVLLTALATAAGCTGDDKKGPPMAQVSGKVLKDGAPVAGGYTVMFSGEGGNSPLLDVGEDGTFSGEAPIGENNVTVMPSADSPGAMMHSVGGDDAKGGKQSPPRKMNQEKMQQQQMRPPMTTVQVTEGGGNQFTFDVDKPDLGVSGK